MNDPDFNSALLRNGILVLLLAVIALVVHNVFSQNGFLALRRQQKEVQSLEQRILQLQRQNQQLDKENRALRRDPAAIENRARGDLRMIKPGEKIYTLPDKTTADPPPPTGKATPPQP